MLGKKQAPPNNYKRLDTWIQFQMNPMNWKVYLVGVHVALVDVDVVQTSVVVDISGGGVKENNVVSCYYSVASTFALVSLGNMVG